MKILTVAFWIIVVLSLIGAATLFVFNLKKPDREVACTTEALICPDGTAVGRTGPNCSFAPCPTPDTTPSEQNDVPDEIDAYIASKANLIVVESPLRDTAISSPVTITGKARGYWFFEASFPITIVDWDGRIIGEGIATAQDEWMTENFVPFTATVAFDLPQDTPYRRGAIILRKDNPSGLPENDNALEIPVTFE